MNCDEVDFLDFKKWSFWNFYFHFACLLACLLLACLLGSKVNKWTFCKKSTFWRISRLIEESVDLLFFIFILLACLLAWVESKISGLTEISALISK